MFWIGCLVGGIATSVIIVILALRHSAATGDEIDDLEVMEQIHKPSNMDGQEWD
jgi:hypothetical protein